MPDYAALKTADAALGIADPGAAAAALIEAGDVSADSHTAINALATLTMPTWQPPVTAGDIQTARAIP